MRKNEVAQIGEALRRLQFENLHIEDASTTFFARLQGVHEPEQARAAIRRVI